MLELEKQILQNYYQKCVTLVSSSKIYTLYADEKIHHSLQVFGACKYILKNETLFADKSPEYIWLAQIACLFHDIGRFEEIIELHLHEKKQNPFVSPYDHGVYGYKLLQTMPEYNDLRIILPIKHHGHLIEALYDDPEYQNIADANLQREVKEIAFLVRDADKAANYQIIKKEDRIYKDLFWGSASEEIKYAPISAEVFKDIEQHQSIRLNQVYSMSDRVLCTIAWVFDMNYKPTFDFIQNLGGLDNLFAVLSKFNPDAIKQESIVKIIKSFILDKYQQF